LAQGFGMSSPLDAPRRAVITGLGVVCPSGNSKQSLWASLGGRQSGVSSLENNHTVDLPTDCVASVREFSGHIDDFGEMPATQKKAIRKALKVMCRETQMGVAAAMQALVDAALVEETPNPLRSGVVYGSDYMLSEPEELNAGMAISATIEDGVDYQRWGTEGMRLMSPLWLLKYLPNMPACHIAIYNDLQGPNNSITQREAGANLAVGEAFHTITRNSADMMIAGATGTRIHTMKAIHAALQEQLALGRDEPQRASRPFDLNRTGMVLGEGAAAIVLEELATAQNRGATIYGEVVGFGSSSVSDRNFCARRDTALVNVMRAALREARLSPEEIGHIHAHGLSTKTCDVDESRAILEVFGDAARRVPTVAAKSNFGNLGAGGGLVELVASTIALGEGHLFPVLNYETPDPECPLNVVRDESVPSGENFMNLSVTPQGQASCVIVRRFG
jgi:3-oxoacyl-[acyl-carrier-protein] synthase II